MQAKDVKYRLTGWTMPYMLEGQPIYVTVHAEDCHQAAAYFGLAGFDVQSIDDIMPTVTAFDCRGIAEMRYAQEFSDDLLKPIQGSGQTQEDDPFEEADFCEANECGGCGEGDEPCGDYVEWVRQQLAAGRRPLFDATKYESRDTSDDR